MLIQLFEGSEMESTKYREFLSLFVEVQRYRKLKFSTNGGYRFSVLSGNFINLMSTTSPMTSPSTPGSTMMTVCASISIELRFVIHSVYFSENGKIEFAFSILYDASRETKKSRTATLG